MRHDYTLPDANPVFQGHGVTIFIKIIIVIIIIINDTIIIIIFIIIIIIIIIMFHYRWKKLFNFLNNFLLQVI